ncbi:MAG: hypothetical protein ACRDMV_18655 [Streptosporangiales bacterium]
MWSVLDKTVAFHVGAHKTATSLLQKYMRDNRELLRKHGIYYMSRTATNRYIGWGDKLVADPDAVSALVQRPLRVPWFRLLVVSHENTLGRPFTDGGAHLYPRAPKLIDALAGALPRNRAKVVLSIRPQDELLESYYLQSVHEGGHLSFAAWLDRLDLDTLSWTPLVDKLYERFGRDRVEVLDFRLLAGGQDAYIRAFFARIDPRHPFDIEYSPRRNPSISEKGLRMALAANPQLRSSTERRLMRRFLQSHFSNVRYPRPALLTDEQRAWLRERYDGEYEQIVAGGPGERLMSAAPEVAAR